jgi:uncharacterized glyoxalase superfamily protein PhnB/DNA-binding XRE family transcriptional regulator
MRRARKSRSMNANPVGEKIRSLRERKAWTQEHLAGAARISPRTVQRAEEGVMSAETKTAIAGALNVEVESLAESTPAITPVLIYEDSKKAFAWLQKAFGFEARERVSGPDGQVQHGELALPGGLVIVTCAHNTKVSPLSLRGKSTQFLYVRVPDVEVHLAKAKKAGAKIVAGLETSYGQKRYRALDLEGHEWCFATEVAS